MNYIRDFDINKPYSESEMKTFLRRHILNLCTVQIIPITLVLTSFQIESDLATTAILSGVIFIETLLIALLTLFIYMSSSENKNNTNTICNNPKAAKYIKSIGERKLTKFEYLFLKEEISKTTIDN